MFASPPIDRQPITLLQGLRAAAALAVTLHHVLNDATALGGPAGTGSGPQAAGLSWDAGIDVFFVISGFVMVYASEPLFAAPGGARRFLARRIARIVPVYWAATAAFLAAAVLLGGVRAPLGGPAYVAASVLFVPWPRADGVMHPLYEVGWTLEYEMFVYALFAAMIALPRRRAVLGASAALLALVAWAPASPRAAAFWADPIVIEFVFGMAVAELLRSGVRPTPLARGLMLAASAAGLAALGLAAPELHRALRFGVPAALLVAAATLGPPPRVAGAGAGAGAAAMIALGDASYALYLAHPFVMRALQLIWLRLHPGGAASFAAYVAAATAGSVAASLAVHAWIERPMTRAARKLLRPS